MNVIDLNCDMGESLEDVENGTQKAILPYITSVNIACGGHAGDDRTMRMTVEQARRFGVTIGAHPGYPDRPNFGRVAMTLNPDEVSDTVYRQICALAEHTEIAHVKPHGALYNEAARNADLARAIAAGVARFNRNIVLVGLAGSLMLDAFAQSGFAVAAEGFADRRYEPDGTLRSRRFPDALIHDPLDATRQAVELARGGRVQTICIHGDTPGAAAIASAIRSGLVSAGVTVAPLGTLRR